MLGQHTDSPPGPWHASLQTASILWSISEAPASTVAPSWTTVRCLMCSQPTATPANEDPMFLWDFLFQQSAETKGSHPRLFSSCAGLVSRFLHLPGPAPLPRLMIWWGALNPVKKWPCHLCLASCSQDFKSCLWQRWDQPVLFRRTMLCSDAVERL